MKLYRFDASVALPLTRFESAHAALARIARTINFTQISVMHLGAGGVVGYHQAAMPQLFMVVGGDGWVRGESDTRVPISVGQAAFWCAGEWHESGTDAGMSALVIESETLDPSAFMPEANT